MLITSTTRAPSELNKYKYYKSLMTRNHVNGFNCYSHVMYLVDIRDLEEKFSQLQVSLRYGLKILNFCYIFWRN